MCHRQPLGGWLHPGNLSLFWKSESYGGFRADLRSSDCAVILISSAETIKRKWRVNHGRMNDFNLWLWGAPLGVGHLSCWHMNMVHHSGDNPHRWYNWTSHKVISNIQFWLDVIRTGGKAAPRSYKPMMYFTPWFWIRRLVDRNPHVLQHEGLQ